MYSSTTPLSLPKETSLKLSELKKKTDLLVNYNLEKRVSKLKESIENKKDQMISYQKINQEQINKKIAQNDNVTYDSFQNDDKMNNLEEEEEEGDFLKNDKAKRIKQGTIYDILQKNEMKSRLFLVEWENKKESYFSGQEIMMYAPEFLEDLQIIMEN